MLFVEQRAGDSLRLPCDVIPPPGDSVAVILWYRDNAPTAIYTYDARNESLGFQQHTPRGPDLASRASFYPKPPAALTITRAVPEDSGMYQCRVDFSHAPSRTTRIQAIVITEIKDIELVRASPPIGSENLPFRGRSVEASLYQPLRLLCRTVGGDPQPKIWWTINDFIIPTRRKYPTSKQKPAMMSLKPSNVRSSASTINISNRQISRNSIRHNNKPIEKGSKDKSYSVNHLLETGIFHAMQRLQLVPDQPFGDIHSTLDVNLYNNASVSTLKISNVTMAYDGASLSCWAANSNLSTPLQVKMELDIFSPPSSVELAGFPEAFVSGEPHPLSCRVYGSRPRPKLEWSLSKPGGPPMKLSLQDLSDPNFWSHIHDSSGSATSLGPARGSSTATQTLQPNAGQRLSSSADRALLRKQSYISGQLKVVLGKEDHGGQLSCVAWNKFFPNSRVNDTRTILVNYAPEVKLELGVQIDPTQVREGSDLYFTCAVDSRPPADLLTWKHKDRTLKNDPSQGVLMSGEHLVLQTVTRNWSGSFSCAAANSIASVVSNTIDINVLYAPVCSTKVKKMYQVQLGEFVSLSCMVDSRPSEVEFEWTFSTNTSKQELVSQEWVRTSGHQSRLRYRPEKIHDYGTIRCFAINAIGRQKIPCEYSVEPAPAPTPPTLNCSVTNQSWHSLNVLCELSRENSSAAESPRVALDSQEIKERKELEQLLEEWETHNTPALAGDTSPTDEDASTSFTLTVESLNSQQVLYNATNNVGTFSVSGLTAGVDYSLTISAMTPLGPTEPLVLTALTLRAAENRINLNGSKGRSNQPPLLDGTTFLAISIGCTMAFFLCGSSAIAIVVCRKARRRSSGELRSNSQNTITHEVEDQDLKIKATGTEAPDLITDETTSRDNLLTVSKLGPRTPNPKHQGCPGCISTQKDSSLGFCSRPEHNCGLHHAAQRTLISSHSLKPAGSQDSAGLTMEIYNPMEAISERCLQESTGMDYSSYDRPLDPLKQSAQQRYCEASTSGYGEMPKQVDLACQDPRSTTCSQFNINVNNDMDHSPSPACNQLLGYSNRFFTLPHKTPSNPTNFSSKSRNLRAVQEAQDSGSKLLLETTFAGRSTESLCSPGSESRV